MAVSADGIPSLQIKIFIDYNLWPVTERVNHDRRADQRQRHEGEPNLRSGEILRSNRADLRADRCAGVHDERDQNIDVALDRVRQCSVAG